MKKIIYGIIVCIIIVGAVLIATIGLNANLLYSKNVRIDAYVGKTFNNEEIKQIAKEVFETDNVIVEQVEYYEDMASILIEEKSAENIDEKIKTLNTKINEKYGVENKVEESISVKHQPKVKLSSLLKPYIMPLAISLVVIVVYAIIRFRKIGMLKTAMLYILSILGSEALYLSLLAITRFPINRFVIPVGMLIYVIVLVTVTAIKENKYSNYIAEEKK